QYGYDITVTRNGDGGEGQPAPTYDVTFDKRVQGGLTGEIAVPGVDPAAELNLGTADSVTMRFNSPEDAARAVSILQRLGAAEAVRDAINAPIPGAGAAGARSNPVPDGDDSTSDTHSWPTPGNLLTQPLRPPQADMDFLRDNITRYSQEVNGQERLKLGAKAANLGIETRFDQNARVIRTVEVPRNGEPGRLTYTIASDLDASTKEKFTVGKQQFDQFEVGYIPQNIVDHGTLRGELSLSWDIPADQSLSEVAGRPVPELGGLGAPDEVSGRVELTYQDQALTDLSRTDQRRFSIEATTRDPVSHAGPALSALLQGDLTAAAGSMGDDFTVTARNERIARAGVNQQHELGITIADVGKAGVSLIGEIGRDDITERQARSLTGTELAQRLAGQPAATDVPEVDDPPPPAQQPEQYVVVPHDGVNVRGEPSFDGSRLSTLRNGTFVDATGQRRIDGNGDEWLEVQGRGIDGQPVTGWVNGRYLQRNETGEMGPNGRINPELESQGYQAVEVRDGETVWDIARRNGVDPQEAVRLNSGHLIDPNMIFAGDKVYIPGTAARPPETLQPEPEQPNPPRTQPNDAPSSNDSARSNGSDAPSAASPSDEAPDSSPSTARPPETTPSGEVPTPPSPEWSSLDEQDGAASDPGQAPSADSSSGSDPAESSSTSPSGETPATGSDNSASSDQPVDPAPDRTGGELDRILHDYQIAEDPRGTVIWSPGGIAGWFSDEKRELTATEADLMDSLSILGLKDMRDVKGKAETLALERYPKPEDLRPDFPRNPEVRAGFDTWAQNDGHTDAFRHAYWNALMTKRFGEDFAARFASAHEGLHGNPADREAMDLYNNEVGRRIATKNPDASEEELADLVQQAIENGEMVVIDRDGELAWSDEVGYGQHGEANDGPAPGVIRVPVAAGSLS
ncbi:LysM peptidoglycan-binding domain-containing protein, partial [Zavarzinia sp.]|uniref:DUF6973 domain-containing protein n=1 Tax=Zavarzinia sp. TaxID=2027920 RepID=UPI0035688B5F